jgi:prepilin-type N-terminal cleavage/methylation domain-containing protein
MMPPPPLISERSAAKGFTLAELLIALAILGVIATFSIPKILSAQQNEKYNAKAKEAIAMVSEAFQQHQANGLVSANTYGSDLSPYMNYVSVDTSSIVDNRPAHGLISLACSAAAPCLKLHNGAILHFVGGYFGGTNPLNICTFVLDPDGVYTGNRDSLMFHIYYNGRIVDRNNCLAGSSGTATACSPITDGVPAWFSW